MYGNSSGEVAHLAANYPPHGLPVAANEHHGAVMWLSGGHSLMTPRVSQLHLWQQRASIQAGATRCMATAAARLPTWQQITPHMACLWLPTSTTAPSCGCQVGSLGRLCTVHLPGLVGCHCICGSSRGEAGKLGFIPATCARKQALHPQDRLMASLGANWHTPAAACL